MPMRAVVVLLGAWMVAAVAVGAETAAADATEVLAAGKRYREIGLSNFQTLDLQVVPSPVPGNGADFYYVWPFTFKNRTSLDRVRTYFRRALEKTEDERQEALLRRNLERVEEQLKRDTQRLRLRVSLHTNTGETYYDLSNPVVRNLAEKRLEIQGYKTLLELSKTKLKPDETVHAMAVFPAIDPEADELEVRIQGFGRVVPAYFPGYLLKRGAHYEPRLRKVRRFLYARPGDPLRRETDPIKLVAKRDEWLWLWSMEIYPERAESFKVERTQGLVYEFRYFPYQVYNSTPDPRKLEVLEAGLAPRVKWNGMHLNLTMTEDVGSPDFWQTQAVKTLQGLRPGVFPAEGERHVQTTIKPGRIEEGVAIVRWGVENPAMLYEDLVNQLRAFAPTYTDQQIRERVGAQEAGPSGYVDEYRLVKAYRAALPETDQPWHRQPLPSDEAIREMVLEVCRTELQGLGVSVSEADERRYGVLAPFAVRMNQLAAAQIAAQEAEGRIPVYFAVRADGVVDTARFAHLFEGERPEEQEIDTEIDVMDPGDIDVEEAPLSGPGPGPVGEPDEPTEPTEPSEPEEPEDGGFLW